MKPVASLTQQIDDLSLHLRTIKANARKASAELNRGFSQRSRRPLESALRWKRYQDATDLEMIAEACLHDLRKAYAMRLAPFKPGEQVIATLAVKGFPATETRYCIWDVEPRSKGLYTYESIRITKAGVLSKRLNIETLWADRFSLRACDEPLAGEAAATLKWRRDVYEQFLEKTVNVGSIDHFEFDEVGYLGRRSVKRRT